MEKKPANASAFAGVPPAPSVQGCWAGETSETTAAAAAAARREESGCDPGLRCQA